MTTLEYHPYTKWNPLNYPIIVTGIIEVLSLVIWLDAIFWHRFGVAAVLCHGFGIAMVSTTIFIFDGVVFIDIIQSGKLIGYYQQRADLRDIKDIARKSDEYPEITRYFLAADSAGNDISNIDVIKIQRYVRRIENKQAHRQEKEKKKEEMRLLAEQQEKKILERKREYRQWMHDFRLQSHDKT
ncbi:hypothetical protein ACJU26_09745 [Acidithiobacillus sp. M4-SHS-6]|uniref:hypothetical protein n=1 Tax=Acidithiobacillus sp. M4-SHS-6 TaxID=3383024 RepID=UPI0039BDD463